MRAEQILRPLTLLGLSLSLFYYSCHLWNPVNISFGSVSNQSKIHLANIYWGPAAFLQALLTHGMERWIRPNFGLRGTLIVGGRGELITIARAVTGCLKKRLEKCLNSSATV